MNKKICKQAKDINRCFIDETPIENKHRKKRSATLVTQKKQIRHIMKYHF